MPTLRLVSLADRAIGLQVVRLEVEQGSAEVTVDARFDEIGAGLDPVRLEQDLGVWRTEQSGKGLSMACAASLQLKGSSNRPRALGPSDGPGTGRRCRVRQQRSNAWSRWRAAMTFGDPGPRRAGRTRPSEADRLAWRARRARGCLGATLAISDIEIKGDDTAQRALRFAIYHLNSAANPADERVSIGARALTGDSYLGHVFWDTEIYLLPFYIATWPEAARALLMYRYHTLPGARAKAARMGWRGALYAWESADTGEETTPEQRHRPRWRARSRCSAARRSSISARMWPTRSGNTGRRPAMTPSCSRPAPKSFWKRRGSGPAAPVPRPTAGAISAA